MEYIACTFCGKEFTKHGIKGHVWKVHTEEGKKHDPNRGYAEGTRVNWNKGKTKETDVRLKQIGISVSKTMKDGRALSGCCGRDYLGSDEHRRSSAKGGGYRSGSGRSKGQYVLDSFGNKIFLQSSYEILCSKILNHLGFKWIRPTSLPYSLNGKERKYYPDFYLPDYDLYLDPKNDYLIKKDNEKIQTVRDQNNVKVLVLSIDELNEDYIRSMVV